MDQSATKSKAASTRAAEIKAALTAAARITPLQPVPAKRRPRLRQRPAAQPAAGQLLASALEKSGFDAAAFERMQAEARAEMQRKAEAQRADALRNSAAARAAMSADVEARRKVIERLVASTNTAAIAQAPQVVLDEPFLIWPATSPPGLVWGGSQIEPWNSWAKFRIDSTAAYGEAEIRFYFLWESSSDQLVVFNASSWLMFSGYCQVDIQGHWWETEWSGIEISAELGLMEPPPGIAKPSDSENVFDLNLDKPSFGSYISPWGERVFRTAVLEADGALVIPQGWVVIMVSALLQWGSSSGGIEADFNSGDFEVMCPFVEIQVVS